MSLRLLAATLGGVAYFLGYLGFGLWPLLFVFWIPLWWAVDTAGGSGTRFLPALFGLAFGAAAHAGGFAWLWSLVEAFLGGSRALGALWLGLHGLWFALGYAVYAAVYAALRGRGLSPVVAGPLPLVLLEWLQPQLFPVRSGAGLLGAPLLAQCADLGGPLLLTGLLALWNALLYEAASTPGRRLALGAAAGAVALAALYGATRQAQLGAPGPQASVLRVGIVQANLDPREKAPAALAGHRTHVAESEALLEEGPLDLVVWPETAYVQGVRRPLPVDASLIRGAALSRARVPLLFGTSSSSADGLANSVMLAGPDGRVLSAYDKNILIPLAEYMPLRPLASLFDGWLPHASRYRASEETPALQLGPHRIATPICYEIAHPAFVARMVRRTRPHLLVTVADDAWFGDSAEPRLHLALARLRAIEQRLPVVRATNSGISAFIDRTGRVTARTGLLERARLVEEVSLEPQPAFSLYARAGDWPGPAAALLLALGLWNRAVRRRSAIRPRDQGLETPRSVWTTFSRTTRKRSPT